MANVSNVILVHGAWADGSSWAKVVPILKAAGISPVAVQLPLKTLDEDVATVKRALALVDGPVVLVGHSYGGAVITEAGNDDKVSALVYVAAFAPAEGESAGSLGASVDPSPLGAELRPDSEGFLKMSEHGYYTAFAQDLADDEKSALYAAQAPSHVAALGGAIKRASWKSKPTWYVVATQDGAIQPSLERTMAKRMGATTIEIEASHLVMISHPKETAEMIIQAAA